jgi:hypothetical protein
MVAELKTMVWQLLVTILVYNCKVIIVTPGRSNYDHPMILHYS